MREIAPPPLRRAFVVLSALCIACGGQAGEQDSAGSSLSLDPDATGATDGSAGTEPSSSGEASGTETAASGSSTGGGGTGDDLAPLTLSIDVTDGECVDLALTDRLTYALRFTAGGPPGAESCGAAAAFCPSEENPPYIPKDSLFVLTDEERPLFDPPEPGWAEFGMAYEDYPLQNLWSAFDAGVPVTPLDPNAGPGGWYELDGTGSQNHALLWLGVSALGYALADDVANFEVAAQKCLLLLDLDAQQGHMRHEAVGVYTGFWQGGIATMALAGLYAPEGAPTGEPLLEASRAWWADHIAVLRTLATQDGQVALTGARLWGAPGESDSWGSLSVAINLQLVDPRPYEALHPTIAQFLTPEGAPKAVDGGVPCRWYRGRHVAERWIVLRAVQSGALSPVPQEHPPPPLNTPVWRWTEGDEVHVATDAVTGYRPARWHVLWQPGEVLKVLIGDPTDYPHTGKGPHSPPAPLTIPEDAALVLSP